MTRIPEIMLLQQSEQSVLAVEMQTNTKDMSQAIGENSVRIDPLFKKQEEITMDVPSIEYPDFENLTEGRIEVITGLRSSEPLRGNEKIQSVILLTRRIVICLHRGNYNELVQLYNETTERIKTNGYKASGASIEYYYGSPDVPEEEHITRAEMPLLQKQRNNYRKFSSNNKKQKGRHTASPCLIEYRYSLLQQFSRN